MMMFFEFRIPSHIHQGIFNFFLRSLKDIEKVWMFKEFKYYLNSTFEWMELEIG